MRLLFLIIVLLGMAPAFAEPSDTKNTPLNFVTLADIHFDPFLSCLTLKPCPLIEKLRRAQSSEWPQILANADMQLSQYGADTNYTLFMAGLAAAKHAANANHAQFFLLLGDLLGHNYREYYRVYSTDKRLDGYQDFVRKTLEFLTSQLNQTFPSLDIYTAVGNNDSYQNDYVTNLGGQFFKDAADIWGSMIKNKNARAVMQKRFATAGYYAIDLPGPSNLRLIVLNTSLFSYKAKGRGLDKAAKDEWDWFHNQLESVKANNQKAFVAMHIPDGLDVYKSPRMYLFRLIELWHLKDTHRFQAEIQRYAPEIAGIFAGHLHSDYTHMLAFDKSEIPMIGTPAISPIFGNNPGFKIITYSPSTQQLDNFVTYYYPLSTKRAWGREYDLNQIAQPDCHPCPSIASMDSLSKGGTAAHFYKLFYSVNANNQTVTTRWPPYYWCAIHKIEVSDYKICVE